MYIYVQIDTHTVMCGCAGVLCDYTLLMVHACPERYLHFLVLQCRCARLCRDTLMCGSITKDTHTVMCGFTDVLCGQTLMCACIHDLIDTRFVMCGYAGVLDCGVTH